MANKLALLIISLLLFFSAARGAAPDSRFDSLIIAPRAMILGYPFLDTSGVVAVDGPMTRACRAGLLHIRKSRW